MSVAVRFLHTKALMMSLTLLASLAVHAAGDDVTAPPPPTPTQRCPDGQVHDAKARKCVPAKSSSLDDKDRYEAVRELAYAERYLAAEMVLDAMTHQQDDRVLTYRGFLLRKTGHLERAARYYQSALDRNPDNILVRSYMGQGYVEAGELGAARQQHREILARGGQGTWAEVSLRNALSSGKTYRY